MLCRESELLEQIDALQDEVAYWKSEAQIRVDHAHRSRLMLRFGLTHGEAWILAALYRARGDTVARDQLRDERPGVLHADEREGNTLQVMIVRLRQKLGREAIGTTWGQGYRLTDIGLALCDSAIQGEPS